MTNQSPCALRFLLTVAFIFCLATGVSAQQEKANSSGLSYQQRVELVKELLTEVREKATTDLSSSERKSYFTKHWAAIEPAWTAKFIVENPIPQDPKIKGRLLYDNDAIRALLARPNEIEEQHLLGLLEQNSDAYIVGHYATLALENLPKGESELKDKIIQIAMKSLDPKMMSPMTFGSRLNVAELSDDPRVIEKTKKEITEFYESGKAMKMWDQMKKQPHFKNNQTYYQSIYRKFAPESMRDEFGDKSGSMTTLEIQFFIKDDKISRMEKAEKLNDVTSYSFGKQEHDQESAATLLGVVATIDHELALKWAANAPSDHLRVWARLTIAPALAKADREAARKMVVECYDQILTLDHSDRNNMNYNFPAASIAGRGLRLVAAVDPILLGDCINKSTQAMKHLETARMSTAKEHIFKTIAAIARYDKQKAETLFENYADDVPLSSAAAFFRALAALHPERILDEYREMPKKNKRGTDYRIYVRNELLPVLTQKTDQGFWDQMNNPTMAPVILKNLDQ